MAMRNAALRLRQQTGARDIQSPVSTSAFLTETLWSINLKLHFKRPLTHYTPEGQLRRDAPLFITKRPDVDNYQPDLIVEKSSSKHG